VISTRTTAREVEQKLEHYDVDESTAEILDALSVERGYSRRSSDRVHYVSTPEDLDGIVDRTRAFLESNEGKLRISVDSVTEMAYYAGVDGAHDATGRLLDLLEEHDAVGLFHLSNEVHDDETLDRFRDLFGTVLELDVDGGVELDE
jgi:KaiC/GvpD/RAD55 family RecA-like ATPase